MTGGGAGATFLSCSSAEPLLLLGVINGGATLASTEEVEVNGGGGAAIGSLLDSGLGAGAGLGSVGSLAGVDRLHVRVVVSLEGLS